MNNALLSIPVLVVLAFLILAIVALVGYSGSQRRKSGMLRERFGPEYNRTVEQLGDRHKAEAELLTRTKRVQSLDIRPLATGERDRFLTQWRNTQAQFVDNPTGSVGAADRLVTELMQARGYPVGTFEQRAADISVDHPVVVENYRAARDIAQQNDSGKASTEDLRQAMVYYRNLFNDLLETDEPTAEERKR